MDDLTQFFKLGVESVDPSSLIKECLVLKNGLLTVNSIQEKHSVDFDLLDGITSQIHILAFGKASLRMTRAVMSLLNQNVGSGVVIMPELEKQNFKEEWPSISCFFGAKNNLPDQNAFEGAKAAVKMVQGLSEEDILLVLISGGGSALFPYPADGISLDEKAEIISRLSKAGATIEEINTVRKRLSKVKGGGLVKMCCCKVIALILSDVIGDPLDVIASGTTVPNKDPPEAAMDVLVKYDIDVSDGVKELLGKEFKPIIKFDHVFNFLIGSNWHALTNIKAGIANHHMIPIMISRRIRGEAKDIGKGFVDLMVDLVKIETTCNFLVTEHLSTVLEDQFDVTASLTCTLDRLCRISQLGQKCLVVLAGGETTVKVKGRGKGGRNQELGLSFMVEVAKRMKSEPDVFDKFEASFLSAGTDGQDGPTDAAGVVVSTEIAKSIDVEEAEMALQENDSYNFFSKFEGGRCLIKTGPTGTNVMDLMFLMIHPIPQCLSCSAQSGM